MPEAEATPQRRRPGRLVLTVVAATAVLLGLLGYVLGVSDGGGEDRAATPTTSPSATAAPAPTTTPVPRDRGEVPTRVAIERIGVDAEVVPLGRADDGSQAVPASRVLTGWWEDGARLGGPGTTALVGHTASTGTAVFDDLGTLERGDEIEVEAGGATSTYRVRLVESIPVEDFAREAARIYSRSGPSRLVLMTCGDFDGTEFRSTVTVWATPVAS